MTTYEEYLASVRAQTARDRARFTGEAGAPSVWTVRLPGYAHSLSGESEWRQNYIDSLLAHMWDGLDARITNQKRTRPARAYRKRSSAMSQPNAVSRKLS